MGSSTRDAILALRKDKQGVDVFETAEAEDGSSTGSAASISTTQAYQHLLAQSKLGGDKKRSEDVVQLDLKPALAFARFAGKIYDSRPETASPALPASAASRLAPLPFSRVDAAAASASSFSTVASSSLSPFEAPVDKFNRLKREIAQFQSDLRAITGTDGKGAGDDVGELAALLLRELAALDDELSGLTGDKRVMRLIVDGEEEAAPLLFPQMIAKLQQATEAGKGTAELSISIVTPPSPLPPSDPAVNLQVLSSLDRRVAALERAVGVPVGLLSTASREQQTAAAGRKSRASLPPGVAVPALSSSSPSAAASAAVLTSYTSLFPDLYTGVMSLHRRLSLLDPQRLDAIHKNIKTINADMELLGTTARENTQTSAAAAGADGGSSSTAASASSAGGGGSGVVKEGGRVQEMYEVLMRWDGWVSQLPVIVSRLQGLRAVHEEARGMLERVRRMEAESDSMRRVLDEDRAALQRLGQTLPDNLKQMDSNMQSLTQRMTELQQRIDRLKR